MRLKFKRRCVLYLFYFLLFLAPLKNYANCDSEWFWDAQFRVSAMYPTDKLFREIYGNVAVNYGLVVSLRLFENFFGWAQVDYFHRNGLSTGLQNKTTVTLCDAAVGLKWLWPITRFAYFYFGAAPNRTFVHVTNDSDYVPQSNTRWEWATQGTIGLYFYTKERFSLDLFGDYVRHWSNDNLHLDRVRVGVGFGMQF